MCGSLPSLEELGKNCKQHYVDKSDLEELELSKSKDKTWMHGDEKYRGVRRLRPFSARCEHQFSTCRQTKFSHTSHTILVFAHKYTSTSGAGTLVPVS